jgi:PAS domain S-box-containing protein
MRRKTIGPKEIELKRLYKELQIHQAELEEQNRELREVQQRLEESRDRYADLYDFSPIGYIELDGRGSIRGINLKGATMLGEARSRLLGIPFTRFVDANDRGRYHALLTKCRGSKGTEAADVVLRPKTGPVFPAQLQCVVSTAPGKGPSGFRTAITDLSDRKLAEETLRESEERFRSLVKNAMIGFFIAQDGKIAFMNPVQEILFGRVPESVKLEEFAVIHPEDRERFLALCRADASADSGSGPVDIRLYPPGREKGDRDIRWVHSRGTPISWRGRKAVLVNMLDITRMRELEQSAHVQEKMAALGHVAAGIAHEIRNPLSGINLHLSSLERVIGETSGLKPEGRDQVEECLRHMKTASVKIATVIQRVMAFSRPIPPTLGMANVNGAVEEAMGLASVALRNHGVKVRLLLSPDLPECRADLHLVGQVLLNLITNADHAMEGRKGSRRLEIRTFREEEWIVLTVADSGPGIPAHAREKIFDPYFTTKRDGTGIGLSFSHKVISSHGGMLTVGKSSFGGAEFRIRLPLRSGKEGT